MTRKLRTLLFSTLYPSSARPLHGVFVETRLRELLRSGQTDTKVVAPVPWFPSTGARFGRYAAMARTPQRETRNGIDVWHPRYVALPKIGMTAAPLLLALGALGALRRLAREGFDFELIDSHYYYPDGVAAAVLAHLLDKPFTITARGSDLNVIRHYALPRSMMRWAGRRADASIGVSQALVDVLRGWGIDRHQLHVIRNGVDLQRFRPLPRDEMRRTLQLQGTPVLMSVGNLLEGKGHHVVIDALHLLLPSRPRARLLIVGEGPHRPALEGRVRDLGIAHAVTFTGALPNEELARWYSAADVLVLASRSEGWPNVLLESLACGTPVVTTNVGAAPEMVRHAAVGRIVDRPDPASVADAVADVLSMPVDREAVRAHASDFGWESTTQAQLRLFHHLVSHRLGREHA
jgi:teichuronic acid biosynthesis glycosyltransferase TuaC